MPCSQHCIWSGGDFHTRDDKKARSGVWLPPSHHLQRGCLPHSLWSTVAVQMSDREQHLGGGPARPEELNRAWCCVRASACHSNDFWLPVVTISEIAVSASRTALARISVSLGWTLQGGGAGGSSCPVPSSLVCGAWKRSLLFRKVLWF